MNCRVLNSCCGLILFAAALVSAPLAGAEAHRPAEVVIEPATLVVAGKQIRYELGTMYVPENRSDPRSRIIKVGFARFKAARSGGAPPTFHLPGGPGNAILEHAQQYLQYLAVSDVVLVEQRGYSTRGEKLMYRPRTYSPLPMNQPTSLEAWNAAAVDLARAAVAEYAAKGIDLSGYSVLELADDVNDLRRLLGYEKISLVGQSFGSQLSFAIMRRHPQIVARALLSGVEPLNNGYDMPSHRFAALQRIAWSADQDPKMQPYLPPDGSGVMGAVRDIMNRLRTAPITVLVRDPETQQTDTVVLGVEDFQILLNLIDAPQAILAVYHGQYDSWAGQIRNLRRAGVLDHGKMIGWLIDSSLGVTAARDHQLHTDPAVEFLGTWSFDPYIASADIWPTRDVGDEFRTPVLTRTPVVFIHGDWDTSTPIENTLSIQPYFPNSRAIIVHGGAHSARTDMERLMPSVMQKVFEFLRSGRMDHLPIDLELPAEVPPQMPGPGPG
jgi:pimeloyl-ACP methyl ester carboxylesterase